jgi:predicted amidohydrolase
VRVGGLQVEIAWEDPEANFDHLEPRIARAAAAGVRLLVLPEMFSTGFSMATEKTAEPVDGPSCRFLREQAARYDLWLGGSLPERPAGLGRPFNTFVLASPAGELHRYRKIHPFSYGREPDHYAAGDGFTTVDVEGLRCTLFVCYDLRFADEFWATAQETDAYLLPANWPSQRRHHWQALLVARAIENQAYVVGLNRVGRDGNDLAYAGDSLIVDPWGDVLASGAKVEQLVAADVDPEVVREARGRFPVLRDRR